MRIRIITNIDLTRETWLRASGIQNMQTAMALADRGHDVLMWVAGKSGSSRAFLERYLGRAAPERFRLMPFKRAGVAGEKKTPFSTGPHRFLNVRRARLRGALPDVVLSRSPRALSQLRAVGAIDRKTKLVMEFQHPEWALLWRGWRKRHVGAPLRECVAELKRLVGNENRWIRLCDGVLYAARAHEPLLRRAGFSGPTAFLSSSCPLPAPGLVDDSETQYDLGYAGSIEPGFGLEDMLEAMAEMDCVSLLLAGGGPEAYEDEIKRRAEELGVAGRIEFRGRVDFHEVRGLMRTCRVGLVPLSARHGPEKRQWASPLNLFEWMSAGVPVLASAIPSVTQHTASGGEAALFAPGHPGCLAQVARMLLDNAARRRRMAESGLALAARSSYASRAGRMADLFEQVLNA